MVVLDSALARELLNQRTTREYLIGLTDEGDTSVYLEITWPRFTYRPATTDRNDFARDLEVEIIDFDARAAECFILAKGED